MKVCELVKDLTATLSKVVEDLDCSDCHPDQDGVLLPAGDHTLTIETPHHVHAVYVSIEDKGQPVCGGDVSKAGATVVDDGFVLYVHIAADQAVVRWIAK